MYGFTITINGKTPAQQNDICHKNIVCSNYMIKKFEQDKVFVETEDFILLLDGFILNRKSLILNYFNTVDDPKERWLGTLIKIYQERGEQFFSVLRGSYSGALYDKLIDKWIIFGDQIGSKFTFYAKVGDFFCVAEEMGQVYKMMRENRINYNLSIDSAYLLLTFGFMIEDKTLCEQVKKIQPGCYLVLENGLLKEKRWYVLNNNYDLSITERDAVDVVDAYFRNAVDAEFSKDTECGYEHISALSGGLDSRMTCYVAHDLGYSKQLNYTFSQSDYLDETIPKKIANDLKHEWIFKFLNKGTWLLDVDGITWHTGGNVLYYGSAHSNSMYRLLNFDRFGIVHTGQISGGLNGAGVSKYDDSFDCFDFRKAMYSTKYYEKVEHLLKSKINQELGWYYYRCLNGTCYGTQIVYNYTESYSPFLDVDFLEHLLQIPITYRINHNLYKKWIMTKYPIAAEYEWEKTGRKISARTIKIRGREMTYDAVMGRAWNYMLRKVGLKSAKDNANSMNPVDHYIANNEELESHLDSYFQYSDAISDTSLREILKEIQTRGTAMEKIQAVSLLAAIKLFYL